MLLEPDVWDGKLMDRITVPLRIISRTLRSPLTVSLVLRLILLGFLVLSSAVFSILAVGAFWYSWGTGGTVEVEGWLTYGYVFTPSLPDQGES